VAVMHPRFLLLTMSLDCEPVSLLCVAPVTVHFELSAK
jgi:hypothetical protein